MAKVIPIFKLGSMAEIDNYRPISVLPTLSKILEKMVHKQLMKHLEFNGFLSEHQFGSRPMPTAQRNWQYGNFLYRRYPERSRRR